MIPKKRKKRVWCSTEGIQIPDLGWFKDNDRERRKRLPARVKCPLCKKRFTPRVRECEDPGCWHVYVPPHKKEQKCESK
jgi:hypothetical protein